MSLLKAISLYIAYMALYSSNRILGTLILFSIPLCIGAKLDVKLPRRSVKEASSAASCDGNPKFYFGGNSLMPPRPRSFIGMGGCTSPHSYTLGTLMGVGGGGGGS